jgi:hypothetical protein
MNQPRITLGPNGWAEIDGWVQAYCTNTATHEYTGPMEVWVSVGTSLPACAFVDEPPAPQPEKTIVRHDGNWMLVDDHRGQTAFDKQTRQPLIVAEFGELPAHLTLQQPGSPYDTWDEGQGVWIKDEAAEQAIQLQQDTAKRTALMTEASQQIAILTDAVELGIATESEHASYTAWRQYRVLLSRLELTRQPIEWPPKPGTAI